MKPPAGLRLFVAAETPDAVRSRFGAVRSRWDRLIPGSRWTRPEAVHLTLKFIGATAEARLAEIARAVAACATVASPFVLTTGRPGLFGSPRHPRVLWVDLEGETSRAQALALGLDGAMAALGFEREQRPFRPHLTLARFDPRRRTEVPDDLMADAAEALSALVVHIDEIVLFQSLPGPGGSQYTPLRRLALGGETA